MDITKGSLEEISRPASSERSRPGSRVSSISLSELGRVSVESPGSLEVLSTETPSTQADSGIEKDEDLDCPSENSAPGQDVSDEETEDTQLQKAIKKMKRLDRRLALAIRNEEEVKKRGRELHQKLWQELQDLKSEMKAECSDQVENTRSFLALMSSSSCSEEMEFVPVFGTQVPDESTASCPLSRENKEVGGHAESSGSLDGGRKVRQDKQTDSRETTDGNSKHRQDFIQTNIELAGDAVRMTQREKERLQELLKDIEEEEEAYDDPLANPELAGDVGSGVLTQKEKDRLNQLLSDLEEEEEEDYDDPLASPEADFSLWTVPTTSGEGYTPQPAELDQLLHIDARLQLLLPVEDFFCVRSPYTDRSLTQCGLQGSDGERGEERRPPGERVLRDMRESRGQEERLREIQQQLQLLGLGQQSSVLPEEQLQRLLEECQTAVSRCSRLSTEDSCPAPYCALEGPEVSLLASMPCLSSSALSELMQEICEGEHEETRD
ncbi:fibrous sheath-interacting protein 1 isoform X1 [Astyanax mexicanus]|uniref:fibrous sheath-interacting protein 1 isoform X1 n=1 Tax=Astyanax mexicanus TaxID=7994 RepID=UPI0020CADFA5|nr:fibrous sheath-interacting protein 1 isoform X1 [Astyanax mexicanus]